MTSDPDPGRLVHIVSDSDDFFFLSLAPLTKELEIFRRNHSNNVLDIARLTMLPHVKVSPFLEPIDRVCTRLHYGPMTEAVWRPVVDRSEAAFRRVRTIRAFLQIWEFLKQESCRQAARLISLALFSLKFPQGWLIEAPVTIFVPNDDAIEKMAPRDFGRLLDRRFRRNYFARCSPIPPWVRITPCAGRSATPLAIRKSDSTPRRPGWPSGQRDCKGAETPAMWTASDLHHRSGPRSRAVDGVTGGRG
jgi:hypothetical protein